MTLIQKGPTLLLKVLLTLTGIGVLTLSILGIPIAFHETNTEFGPIFVIMYISMVPSFYALYRTIRLLNNVDNNQAFSQFSVNALRQIKYCSTIFAVMYALGLPYLYQLAQLHDAPGIMAFGCLFTFAGIMVAATAHVLQTLIQNAAELKSESDLTV